jgi:peptidoglycan hydrolase-like protein with peptidoglycan-binding domain
MATKASSIKKSVGEGADNQPQDVLLVQYLLNLTSERQGVPKKPVPADGKMTKETIAAIKEYQTKFKLEVDGLLEPGGETITSLNKTTPTFAANDGKAYLTKDPNGKRFA